MLPRCLLAACLAAGSTVLAQAPATKPGEPPPSAEQLNERIAELIRELPTTDMKSPPPTPEQADKAAEAARLYRQAAGRIRELDALAVTMLGLRAGLALGDADTLLSAAKVRWQQVQETGAGDFDAYVLAWAGIFAGDADAARQGLRHLADRSEDKSLRAWAKDMLPIAGECKTPVDAAVALTDGGKVDLARPTGKAVVLYFWASWSDAAAKETPALRQFQRERRKDERFLMLGVCLDRTDAEARRAIGQSGMDWPQSTDRSLRRLFLGSGVPHVVVISYDGRVLWQGHPALKNTLTWTTDFARRQAAWQARQTSASAPAPATRPQPPVPEGGGPTPAQQVEAENLYTLARTYLKLRMNAKAKETLEDIARRFPGTPAAARATEDLKGMR